jgi:N-acyl-D-amino-acid deacylase
MLFTNATVVDGTGGPRYSADVRVRDGRVAEIGQLAPSDERGIDATGKVLAPGFVDMHAHSDLALITDSAHLAKVTQGVTTEVIGQDGLSYAPVDGESLAIIRRQIAGWHGSFPDKLFSWRSVGEYLDRLDQGMANNQAYLVPQGNLRMLAVGTENRPAAADELDRMRGLLADGLAAGAVGMSSGLTYAPGMFADTAELEALCTVVAEHAGYYSPHTRSYGGSALAAFAEMIEIGRRTGCPIHLTHATMNFAPNRGRASELLALIDDAVAAGVDVTLDSYPYLPGSTTLAALLPSWTATGGPDAVLERLRNPRDREAIRRELDETGSDGAHGEVVDWSVIQVSGVGDPALAHVVGHTIAELAGDVPATEFALDLMLHDQLATGILMHIGDEANVREIMAHPRHTGGSDGILVGDRPHPRAWGTFARYLGHYSRDEGVLSLEECVKHLAGNPAQRLGWTDRGLVREGYVADLVLFDPRTIADRATFEEPRRPAVGISHVLVNGELVIDDGARTGSTPGLAIRRLGR